MFSYVFDGKVIPEWAAVSINIPDPLMVNVPEFGLTFKASVKILVSQISVLVESEQQVADLATLRNYVDYLVRSLVDAYGYLEGRGYDIEITSVTGVNDNSCYVFGIEIARLQENKLVRPVDFSELVTLLLARKHNETDEWFKVNQLRSAIANLREAIRSPHDTGLFCYRAVESLMQGFKMSEGRGDNNRAWEQLRTSLLVDRSWFTQLEAFSKDQRHGLGRYMSEPERVSVMERAWQIVDRFVIYAKGGFQPLSDDDFETLM